MGQPLLQRIQTLVRQALESYTGAWLVWCDPDGHWLPLLQRAASAPGGFTLVTVESKTANELGGPRTRRELQARLDAGESFVLYVPVARDRLGWLWGQALQAEAIYDRALREQLMAWGWHPLNLTTTDDQLALLARRAINQDPAEWGGASLQPDFALLLEVLAGGAQPDPDDRFVLDMTIERAGLPPLDEGDLARWRERCLARLLVTQAYHAAPDVVPAGHELLIGAGERAAALKVLESWIDSLRLSKGLPEAILAADRIAGLSSLAGRVTAQHGPFVSQAAEKAAFSGASALLRQQTGQALIESLAALQGDLDRHAAGFWGAADHKEALPWPELVRLCRAARGLLEALPAQMWGTPDEAVAWYIGGGWRLDQALEEVMRDLSRPTPELLSLVTPLREAFRVRWQDTLISWSEVWVGAGCMDPALPTAGEWLIERLHDRRPTAILYIDAFRYDLASTLAARLNAQEGAERARVGAARAPLPSVTALGMGMALPILESKLKASLDNGKWQLTADGYAGNLSVADNRRGWWKAKGKVVADAFLDLSTVQSGASPPPAPQRTRLIVHDDIIDKLGHDDQLEALGAGLALERYLAAIERLRDAGWTQIFIVTDHGYIHWTSVEEKSAQPPASDPLHKSRRAAIYPSSVYFEGPQGMTPGARYRVAVPYGPTSFSAYGGLGYFHGGASLQEWIIPCVEITWPMKAQPVAVRLEPLPQVLSRLPKVTLTVVRDALLPELASDALARQVDVVIRDKAQGGILFKSEPVHVTPGQPGVSVTAKALESAVAQRGTPLRVEVRDTATEVILDAADSTLMIELTEW